MSNTMSIAESVKQATIEYQSPSNIALVKYWGKKGVQIPMNPSISFTLSNCATTTSVDFEYRADQDDITFEFIFEGEPKPSFHPKLDKFFSLVIEDFPELKHYHLSIKSSNSFPHSSGIASSASAMSALAMCLGDFEKKLKGHAYQHNLKQRVSHWSRLGSGSACRSIFPGLAMWGAFDEVAGSHDEYAIEISDVAPVFKDYCDIVLLVDKGKKKISSTTGHKLMNGHPYAEARINHAKNNLRKLMQYLRTGDLKGFIEVVENESLTLHAMMLASNPGFFLIHEGTLKIIEKTRYFREQEGVNLCFTLDAGANVHLLYPKADHETIITFVNENLLEYCENEAYICDKLGEGPKRLKEIYG